MSDISRPGRVLRWLLPLMLLPVLATVAIYVINPLGTATADPRARLFGYMVVRLPSVAMAPTLSPGDILFVDTTAYWRSEPKPGDVLVYQNPEPPFSARLHRVAAVPGDRVDVRGGNLWVNGEQIGTPLDDGDWPTAVGVLENFEIPDDRYFVVGDNPLHSADSRLWGTLPRDNLIGRATRVISGARPGPLPPWSRRPATSPP
jgi:signal peptidase I